MTSWYGGQENQAPLPNRGAGKLRVCSVLGTIGLFPFIFNVFQCCIDVMYAIASLTVQKFVV